MAFSIVAIAVPAMLFGSMIPPTGDAAATGDKGRIAIVCLDASASWDVGTPSDYLGSQSSQVVAGVERLLKQRGVRAAVLDRAGETGAPEATVASLWRAETGSAATVYVGVACRRSSNDGVRIRHPALEVPANDHRGKPVLPEDVRRLVAAERARNSMALGQLIAEALVSQLGMASSKLEPSGGDYVLDNTPGAAVLVELLVGAGPRSIGLCTDGRSTEAMADAIREFLAHERR